MLRAPTFPQKPYVLGYHMNAHESSSQSQVTRPALAWLGVLFAIVFPSIVTWVYFFQVADAEAGVQRVVMGTMKALQFTFPLLWVAFALKARLRWPRPTTAGMALGAIFGIAVTAIGWLTFDLWLREMLWFLAAVDPIRAKIADFGLDSPAKFIALGVFYSLIHSLLEEYYWRWFVFGQLRRLIPLWPAIAFSSLGFMAHHVLVLSSYFGWWTAPTMLLSAAVAVGGVFWAWLYDRTNSLYGPWLSHAMVDAGIFFVGYSLLAGHALQ